jgi:nicotinamidase-related amidase
MEEKINTSKFGVIIVDMQSCFLSQILQRERLNLLSAHEKLLQVCKKRDYPVVALEYLGGGRTIPELVHQIDQIPRHNFFLKTRDDGFFRNENLQLALEKWGLEYICISGIYADFCVLETARGAVRKGFKVITAKDLIASYRGIEGVDLAEKQFYYQKIASPEYNSLIEQVG